jgi:hypothetical protein
MAKRVFDRPAPGNRYTAAERAEWGRQQDRARAARAAQAAQTEAVLKPPAKRQTRAKTLVADTSGSECFDSLVYRDGTVTASFIGPAAGEWQYDMSLADAREWFGADSLGGFFNDEIREPPVKGN